MWPPRSPASRGPLPPEGVLAAFGRPGGGSVRPPCSPAARGPLPAEGAFAAFGRPGGGSMRPSRHQSGAALLAAMITVTLVATIAAAALWRQWRGVEVEAAERARVQSAWILTGALDWGRLILAGDQRESTTDHLAEPWAVPLAEARLSTFLAAGESSADTERDAFLSGHITDLQSRLNLMNLVAGDPADPVDALARFGRLFDLLGLPASELAVLQRSLVRAQAALAGTATGGDAPLMPRRFEQLAWLGVSPATLAALRPYATLLPLQGSQATPINLNTASAQVIHAAVPGLDLAQAQRLVTQREQGHFKSVQAAMSALGVTGADLGWAAVASSFFEIRGRLRLDDMALEEVSVVQRLGRVRGVVTLWRERAALSLPAAGAR